ncbi:mitochondrial carrier [Jaminaea rosea]|uniref:Mitochondrial carrier n=1 Tax=Jaminaea rosea TaxID=1569628 RepID=A0A316UN32_9BASI|nr:mitochondrial carrier [Jaminaea rosea]PWN26676.1 mitochondrial carrier [Jaminaea rosea]
MAASSPSSSSRPSPSSRSSFFPTPAIDHSVAGITAGAVATVCMNPLDLIKTQFQVDTTSRAKLSARSGWATKMLGGQVAKDMVGALRRIVQQGGWTGLYRGLSPNVVGNSASWGLYFLWYTMIKERMAARAYEASGGDDGEIKKLSAGQHLLAASESGAITALMTNPIWVVKTRMFTTTRAGGTAAASNTPIPPAPSIQVASSPSSAAAASDASPYRTLRSSLVHIYRNEGFRGLYKGTGLALFGVSNGAIQFMAYEQLKRHRSNVALKKRGGTASAADLGAEGQVKLSNVEYTIISGLAKLVAIGLTYPYQVVRSRYQNHATAHLYPTVTRCIQLTYRNEGLSAFYKGMSANLVRILPATCVTFVVYENVSWTLKRAADSRRRAEAGEATDQH